MNPKPTLDERPPEDPDATTLEPRASRDATTLTGDQPPGGARKSWSPPAAGTRVDRYEVRRPLGQGGMGTVVSAWDPELARPVALKFVGRLHQGGEQQRLLREAQAMAQLKHPNVVPVYDVGTWQGRVFLAMELVDGVNLKEWVDARRREPHEVVDLLCQVGGALSAAHAAGIVHRDVKPANVLVDGDGRARITDFGIARVGDSESPEPTPVTLRGPIGDATAYGVAEAYVARWRDASLGACFTRDLAQRPTRIAQAQRDCLDGALLALDAKVTALEDAAATASEADAQLRELDDPRGCVDHWSGETARAAPWPPP